MSLEKRNERLDFMKGIAILFVILNHNIPLSILDSYKYFYHIGQAVPIFMMVSGYLVYAKYSSQDLLENYHHFISEVDNLKYWVDNEALDDRQLLYQLNRALKRANKQYISIK